jgi:hypothetical protein
MLARVGFLYTGFSRSHLSEKGHSMASNTPTALRLEELKTLVESSSERIQTLHNLGDHEYHRTIAEIEEIIDRLNGEIVG